MNKYIIDRIINESKYIINTKSTIREVAKKFNVSKSTVHKDVSYRLLELDTELYKDVAKILKYHIDIRHIRGGESTKRKYMQKKDYLNIQN